MIIFGKSTVLEDTDGCAKQYRCDIAIYLITVLSSIFGTITDHGINIPGHECFLVDGINATRKI